MTEEEKKKDSSEKVEKKDKDKKKHRSSSSKKKDGEHRKRDKADKDGEKSERKSKKESKKHPKKDSKKDSTKKDSKKKSKKDFKMMDGSISMIDASEKTAATMAESMSNNMAESSSAFSLGKSLGDFNTTEKADADDDDAAMRALLDSFIGDLDDDSSTSSSSSEESGNGLREVDLQDNVFDHVVLAAPELNAAIAEFQEKTGVAPVVTGSIRGLGIRTARVSFEGASFLEIIAPDPDKAGPIGTLLKSTGLKGLVPFHWAIRSSKAEAIAAEVPKLGLTPDFIGLTCASGDGSIRKCENTYLYGQKLGGMCPFFVNYDSSDHPCQSVPVVGELISVKISAPGNEKIHDLIDHTKSDGFTLVESPSPHFELIFDSPDGEVTFEATKMVGFRFPGYEEEMGPIIGEEDFPELVMPEIPTMDGEAVEAS